MPINQETKEALAKHRRRGQDRRRRNATPKYQNGQQLTIGRQVLSVGTRRERVRGSGRTTWWYQVGCSCGNVQRLPQETVNQIVKEDRRNCPKCIVHKTLNRSKSFNEDETLAFHNKMKDALLNCFPGNAG